MDLDSRRKENMLVSAKERKESWTEEKGNGPEQQKKVKDAGLSKINKTELDRRETKWTWTAEKWKRCWS
jgi:hypothetical protein